MTRNIGQRDSRDKSLAADGEIMKIPTLCGGGHRPAGNPRDQSRQLYRIIYPLITAFDLQACEPPGIAGFEFWFWQRHLPRAYCKNCRRGGLAATRTIGDILRPRTNYVRGQSR